MQTNIIYTYLNIIVKILMLWNCLGINCVSGSICGCHKMLAQKLNENIRSGQIYTKLMVLLYLFSLILRKFICQT